MMTYHNDDKSRSSPQACISTGATGWSGVKERNEKMGGMDGSHVKVRLV